VTFAAASRLCEGEQCLHGYFPFTVHKFVYILCTCSFVEGFYTFLSLEATICESYFLSLEVMVC